MEKNVNVSTNGGLGFCSILTIIFVLLKAFGVIGFTWFQCFLPLIIGGGLTLLLIIIFFIIALIIEAR